MRGILDFDLHRPPAAEMIAPDPPQYMNRRAVTRGKKSLSERRAASLKRNGRHRAAAAVIEAAGNVRAVTANGLGIGNPAIGDDETGFGIAAAERPDPFQPVGEFRQHARRAQHAGDMTDRPRHLGTDFAW